jgi:uncharacterized protein (TIGR02594 family)
MLQESLRHHGTLEHRGPANNPSILKWAHEIGGNVEDVYKADSIPWCGLYMAILAKRCGYEVVKDPLWALNWGTFGKPAPEPELGDVGTFIRHTEQGKRAGHTALIIARNTKNTHYLIHGGNQKDSVCFTWIEMNRLYTARQPLYKSGNPYPSRRIYWIDRDNSEEFQNAA